MTTAGSEFPSSLTTASATAFAPRETKKEKKIHTARAARADVATLLKMIEKRMALELPFMMTENIIMEGVKRGGDRQELHEKIRILSLKAGHNIKNEGKDNNLLELLAADEQIPFSLSELKSLAKPANYYGRAPEQVDEFIKEVVSPIIRKNRKNITNEKIGLKV